MKLRSILIAAALALTSVAMPTMAHAAGNDTPLTGPYVPLPSPVPGAVVAGKPFNTWPLCGAESSHNCRWDARLLGNGRGTSFVDKAGKRYSVSLSAVPARGTLAYFPQCPKPTYTGKVCWYSANTRGDGLGRDYYFTSGGVKKYVPYQMIES
jgi:hypothetical protein